jgi:hypothetical protein
MRRMGCGRMFADSTRLLLLHNAAGHWQFSKLYCLHNVGSNVRNTAASFPKLERYLHSYLIALMRCRGLVQSSVQLLLLVLVVDLLLIIREHLWQV